MAELEEGTGESSSPPRGFRGGVHVLCDIRNQIYARLVESGCEEAVADPDRFRKQLEAHFDRFPESYSLDVHAARAEDVLLHQKILAESEDPKNRPVFHVRFLKNDDMQPSPYIGSSSEGCHSNGNKGDLPPNRRIEFEPCSRLEDLNLNMRKISKDIEDRSDPSEALSTRNDIRHVPIHEITFSSIDKPKVLCQGTDDLLKELREAATRNNVLLSGSLHSSASGRILELHQRVADTDIDTKFLKMGEKIAVGSCGDLFRGTYLGLDVAIKVLRSERLSEALQVEFDQEVMILRKVDHINVVRFYGACTKPPDLCIITAILVNKVSFSLTGCPISLIQSTDSEYMHGGNLYDYLHKQERVLELSVLLKIAIDVCKGMDYLHKNNIIHRDLKTANLLIDRNQVVKVADFGVARFQSQKGIMTAETGTYRWMAPEVINHKHYDFKADVFSFAIVLWELATSKVPYENLTPLQAALGVRLGMRPELPNDRHPRLLDLMQRCWQENPDIRSSFPEILIELEELLQQVQANGEANQQSKTKIQKKSQNK
ncbi:serine/threonine-protein kinase STY17-like isoform X6 [Ananas comosus]|uniref:Serine/threonine-protein kinase STY17-like isoform X6 n=1 Tax=Ananas comosus TaxID=4615 RepID=A0A6P5F5A6_ANACO|nr:serine/threonine-protein kinase STY17-like isoform X6 [Ananas comosus]